MTSARIVAKLIEATLADVSGAQWTQNADEHGLAACDGCGERKLVVYSSCLQWCQSCWPLAASHNRDTQSTDWAQRREVHERDYGWAT